MHSFVWRPMRYRLSRRPFIVLGIVVSLAGLQAPAQQPEFAVQGYITALSSPTRFEVSGQQVEASANTSWEITGKGSESRYGQPLQSLAQVGVFVRVTGPANRHSHIIAAQEISLRDDWDRKLSGIGVIDNGLEAGSQPTFRADGYRIRITPATEGAFSGELKALRDLAPNTWLHFEGKLDKNGTLIASKINFLLSKPARYKSVLGHEVNNITVVGDDRSVSAANPAPTHLNDTDIQEPATSAPAQPDVNSASNAKTRFSEHNSRFKEVEDPALQARVQRIGVSVVPAYQKALPGDHPTKIQSRFVPVDDTKYRSDICSPDGLILVPRQGVERLKRDDQLAAVRADGVAFDLQRQAARIVSTNRVMLGAAVAGDIVGAFVPGLGLAAWA